MCRQLQKSSTGYLIKTILEQTGLPFETKMNGKTHLKFTARAPSGDIFVHSTSVHKGSWEGQHIARQKLKQFLKRNGLDASVTER